MSTIDDLLESMPGLAGVVARDIADTAWIRQPMLAIQSSLCLMSCLKGQNVQYESGMRANLFTIGVAGSGCGKEHGLEYSERLLSHLDIGALYVHNIGSTAAFQRYFTQGLCNLFIGWDEIGQHLKPMLSEYSRDPLAKQIGAELFTLHTKSRSTYMPRAIGGHSSDSRENAKFLNPNLTINGVTVQDPLFKALQSGNVVDGLLPRFLYFVGSNSDALNKRKKEWFTPEIESKCFKLARRTWFVRRLQSVGDGYGVDERDGEKTYGLRGTAREVDFAEDTKDYAFRQHQFFKERKRSSNMIGQAIYSRAYEQFLKVCLCIEDGRAISFETASFASTIVTLCVQQLIQAMNLNVSETPAHANALKVRRIVAEAGTIESKKLLGEFKDSVDTLQKSLKLCVYADWIEVVQEEDKVFYKTKG